MGPHVWTQHTGKEPGSQQLIGSPIYASRATGSIETFEMQCYRSYRKSFRQMVEEHYCESVAVVSGILMISNLHSNLFPEQRSQIHGNVPLLRSSNDEVLGVEQNRVSFGRVKRSL